MPGKMSNRDRIARMAAEAEAAGKEKQADRQARAESASRSGAAKSRAKRPPARVKIVWAVCDQTGSQVKSYPYAEEAAALADAQQRTTATGRTHFVTRAEVPLE